MDVDEGSPKNRRIRIVDGEGPEAVSAAIRHAQQNRVRIRAGFAANFIAILLTVGSGALGILTNIATAGSSVATYVGVGLMATSLFFVVATWQYVAKGSERKADRFRLSEVQDPELHALIVSLSEEQARFSKVLARETRGTQ